jgi:hypothetical protein
VAFVQDNETNLGGAATSIAVALTDSNVKANSLLIAWLWTNNNGDQSPTIDDNQLNANWTRAEGCAIYTGNKWVYLFYCWGCAAGATTVTAHFASQFAHMIVEEHDNFGASTPYFDSTSTSNQETATPTSGNMTATAQANALIVGLYGVSADDATIAAGTDFTLTQHDGTRLAGEYRYVTQTGTYAASFTNASQELACVIGAIFYESVGGGGPGSPPMFRGS